MSAETEKLRDTFADQLASFDDLLEAKADDVDLLADIQKGIGELLATGDNSEIEIRRVLDERYKQGSLREETFQLVRSMLDRNLIESVWADPALDAIEEPEGDDAFGSTTVIAKDIVPDRSAKSRAQVGSLLRDRFLLQEEVSGGSMGVVYKALDRRLAEAESPEPWVAIKVLSPRLAENVQALRALQQEAAKGRFLVHPNIVRFIDLDRDDDLHFLVMEWLEGRNLAELLDSADAKSVDLDAAFRIVEQVGDALDYAHRCGIVHADVKPGNIMLMQNGDAKLFDFGVARVRQEQTGGDFDPGVLGAFTPAYSSMQVLTGEEPTAADDVFSLACLLYRLVAGHRVFGPRNAAEASQEGMKPQRPQGLNDAQWRALKKALSYARVTRFSSIKEFTDALEESGDDTINLEAPERFETEQSGGIGKWLVAGTVLLGLMGGAAYKFGYLDPWLVKVDGQSESANEREHIESLRPAVEAPATAIDDDAPSTGAEETGEDVAEPDPPQEPFIDFSTLPPATFEVSIAAGVAADAPLRIRLREDGEPVIVDFVRAGGVAVPLTLRLDEVGFSGNRSPWSSGHYALSNSGIVRFPVGQDRGRVTLIMASDPLREADQQSTLRLREADSAETALAILNVTLEDDDQRAFEAQLPVNTIGFAAGQASIREAAPAVQIDIVRFNPDSSPVVVGYTVSDVTASNGEDYFAPASESISFGPGQRSARLLIPLVQDSEVEGDEAFVVELASSKDSAVAEVYQRIVVMIRDDEPQSP